jgi:hypothetical protein
LFTSSCFICSLTLNWLFSNRLLSHKQRPVWSADARLRRLKSQGQLETVLKLTLFTQLNPVSAVFIWNMRNVLMHVCVQIAFVIVKCYWTWLENVFQNRWKVTLHFFSFLLISFLYTPIFCTPRFKFSPLWSGHDSVVFVVAVLLSLHGVHSFLIFFQIVVVSP